MDPRLAAIRGPLKGKTFHISEEEVSVGRQKSNTLCLDDRLVSRRHCLIKKEGDRFKITDLDSSHGTVVNGTPIRESFIVHGDQIRMADSLFLFLLEEGEELTLQEPIQLDEGELMTQSTVQLESDNSRYLGRQDLLTEALPAGRIARDLNALLRISTTINSIQGLEPLQRRLLELIFEVVPAERGAILTIGEVETDYRSVCSWDRLAGADQPVRLSRTIVDRVLKERAAVLSNHSLQSGLIKDAESLVSSGVQSVLCVPLVVLGKLLGLIYLETSDATAPFDEDHLHLLTAIAAMAAVALENNHHVEWLQSENRRLQEEFNIEHDMIGESAPMRKVYGFISKVAVTDSTVLICGENGTGKELAARATHQNSSRAGKPFVVINCATLTDNLLESELFGHEKGAFTGAIAQKKGKLEVAHGGTVFLDEVGELAAVLQVKLLRVLQEREFERVGGTRPIKVDIRLLAATNKDLEKATQEKTFRPDLYYRLNVVSLTMPSLSERREDIPLLAQYFATKYSEKCGRPIRGISPEARVCLMNYSWPGNVRELQNAIERAIALGSTDVILPEDLPETLLETEAAIGDFDNYHELIKEKKKELILNAVEQANGNYTEAAKRLGLHPNYLHRLIRNLNLKAPLKKRAK